MAVPPLHGIEHTFLFSLMLKDRARKKKYAQLMVPRFKFVVAKRFTIVSQYRN